MTDGPPTKPNCRTTDKILATGLVVVVVVIAVTKIFTYISVEITIIITINFDLLPFNVFARF